MFDFILNAVCALAVLAAPASDLPTQIKCVSAEYQASEGMEHAVGWYNGNDDVVYLMNGLGFEYTQQVLAHELAHASDLAKGTEMNGYPSFFSETRTGFTVEEYARLVTYVEGTWPEDEIFPDTWVYYDGFQDDVTVMQTAGWLTH